MLKHLPATRMVDDVLAGGDQHFYNNYCKRLGAGVSKEVVEEVMAVGERTAMLWLEQFIAMTLDALQLHPQEGSMFRVTYHILEERDEEESWMKDGYEEDEEEDAAEEEEAAGVDAMDVDE